jgi:hypothetical protein
MKITLLPIICEGDIKDGIFYNGWHRLTLPAKKGGKITLGRLISPDEDLILDLWYKVRQVGLTRRKFLVLLTAGGAVAVLAACGQSSAPTTTKIVGSTAKPAPVTTAALSPPPTSNISPPAPAGGAAPPPPQGQATFTPFTAFSSGKMVITSSVVKDGGTLTDKYTCNGVNSGQFAKVTQLPLQWTGAPAGTKSFAIIAWGIKGGGDEGIPWLVYNISPDITSLPENMSGIGLVGMNDEAKQEYRAPCGGGPGTYKRYFVVYALSTMLNLPDPTRVDASLLRQTMKEYILDSATFTVVTII